MPETRRTGQEVQSEILDMVRKSLWGARSPPDL